MMRLSISRTPETREATVSALSRKFPLLDAAVSVILPFAADTIMPAGASVMPISSLSAALTLVSSSLSASAERDHATQLALTAQGRAVLDALIVRSNGGR